MNVYSLNDWLTHLEQLHPSAIDMGLDRLRQVANNLKLSRPAPLVITVTGTNGKGSTCAFIAALLTSQGLNVGCYNSPHLLNYEERISINTHYVTEKMLCDAFTQIEQARNETSLTFFEFGTLAAFLLFEQAQLDAVVLEVGLGGRLDAVNLIDADISVITSIGIDHQEYLGTTREAVAFEKAGIFRSHKPVVCGDPAPPITLIEQAQLKHCPLFIRNKDFDFQKETQNWHWQGLDLEGNLCQLNALPPLTLPIENAALALQVFALLDFPLEHTTIADTLTKVNVRGRFERHRIHWHGKTVNLLLDVGHNPHAANYLASYLASDTLAGDRYAVFGLLQDKDLLGVIAPLLPYISDWAVSALNTPRTNTAESLSIALQSNSAKVSTCSSITDALELQCNKAMEEDEILVFGSFYVVAEALTWLASIS